MRRIDAAMLAELRSRPLVVLSPHFDDACFSLGGLLQRLQHGHLINIFTQGTNVAAPGGGWRDQVASFAVRDAEDAAFAARCGLVRHDLGCEEPVLRDRSPHDLRHVQDDLGQIAGPLLAKLEKLAAGFPQNARATLLAPLGIGRHVNHRATAMLVMQALPVLRARYRVCFYEDQPYARAIFRRLEALRRVHAGLGLVCRHVLALRWEEKSALVGLYPSQHRRAPRAADFWPKALSPWTPHEAFWSVREPFGAPA